MFKLNLLYKNNFKKKLIRVLKKYKLINKILYMHIFLNTNCVNSADKCYFRLMYYKSNKNYITISFDQSHRQITLIIIIYLPSLLPRDHYSWKTWVSLTIYFNA